MGIGVSFMHWVYAFCISSIRSIKSLYLATFGNGLGSGGMNGSIIYELERPENAGLKRSIKVF